MKPFTICVRTHGQYQSNFVFTDAITADNWIANEFPKLKKQYTNITYDKESLPGLKIGDRCNVWGEAQDEFIIVGIKKYSEHRYGFILDSGCAEEVAKCHTQYLTDDYEPVMSLADKIKLQQNSWEHFFLVEQKLIQQAVDNHVVGDFCYVSTNFSKVFYANGGVNNLNDSSSSTMEELGLDDDASFHITNFINWAASNGLSIRIVDDMVLHVVVE